MVTSSFDASGHARNHSSWKRLTSLKGLPTVTPRGISAVLVTILGVLASVAALQGSTADSAPLAWVSAFALIVLVDLAALLAARHETAAVVAVILACTAGVFGAFELFLSQRPVIERRYTPYDSRPHPVLGYAPFRDSTRATATYRDAVIYDIEYTYDSTGLRISTGSHNTATTKCILFFGGSYTFGEGVADWETLPSQVAIVSPHNVTYNFGFRGYGAHQMLAAIEQGIVDRAVRCNVTHIVYTMISDHVRRAAGRTAWDTFGPRYELEHDSILRFAGAFADSPRRSANVAVWGVAKLKNQATKSLLLRLALSRMRGWEDWRPNDYDTERFIAIVGRSARILENRYGDSSFHVLAWDVGGGDLAARKRANFTKELARRLRAIGISVTSISAILPDYEDNRERYLIPFDGHPSPRAYELVARQLVKEILTPSGSRASTSN